MPHTALFCSRPLRNYSIPIHDMDKHRPPRSTLLRGDPHFFQTLLYCFSKNSEYDQEIPRLQTAD